LLQKSLKGKEKILSPLCFLWLSPIRRLANTKNLYLFCKRPFNCPRKIRIFYIFWPCRFNIFERYDQASRIYERLTFLSPVKNRVYYNLGLVYGRQDKLVLAHYNLGIYFSKLRRKEKALFHFKKGARAVRRRASAKRKDQ